MRTRALLAALAIAVVCAGLAALSQTSAKAHVIPPPEARVDINSANMDQLLKVPGMTRAWAGRILRFRPYHTKADLFERGVVSGEAYDRFKDYIIAHREKLEPAS